MQTIRHLSLRLRSPASVCVVKRSIHKTEPKVQEKEVQEITIPVPWGHIAGKWWGQTDVQPLIGLHGWEDNAGTFDTLAPLLKINSFLAIDLPGHGLSSYQPEGRPYTVLDSVLVLRRIVKYFNWERVSLIGHSYGSCISFIYAAVFPHAVDNYISIDCARTLMAPDCETELGQMRNISNTLHKLEEKLKTNNPPSYSYDEIVDAYYAGCLESPTKESCKILLKRGLLNSSQPDKYYFARDPRLRAHAMGRLPFEFILDFANNISCNHLSVRGRQGFIWHGEKEDVYIKSLENIKKEGFKFEHHDVEGTHHLHLNNPDRIGPLVNKFLGFNEI